MGQSHASTIRTANRKLLAERELDAVDEFFAPDYVSHIMDRDMTGGPTAVRRWLGRLYKGFSDLDVEVEILVESEDRVAWQRTVSGSQVGAFMGFPASNRRVVWRDMFTSRFEDGRIAEEWAISGLAERLLLARRS